MRLQDAVRIADDVLIDSDDASLRNFAAWDRFAFRPLPVAPERPETLAKQNRLSEDAQKTLKLARIRYHGSRRVLVTSSANSFLEEARDLLASNEDEPNAAPGLLLTGRFSSGKTTLATDFGREFHVGAVGKPAARVDFEDGHAPHVPVIYLKVTTGMTTKQANQALASFFGMEPGDATRYNLTDALSRIMTACGTRLLICDDVHRLASGKREVAGHLKDLADVLPVTFIFVHGVPEGIHALGDEILERFTEHRLTPVDRGAPEWQALLQRAEGWLDLYHQQPGDLTTMADYLWERTGGYVSVLCPLLRKAATHAVRSGYERVDQALVAKTRMPKRSEEREQKAKDKAAALAAVGASPVRPKRTSGKRSTGVPRASNM